MDEPSPSLSPAWTVDVEPAAAKDSKSISRFFHAYTLSMGRVMLK